MNKILALILASVASVTLANQPPKVVLPTLVPPVVNPCVNLGNPPTIVTCWGCYKFLLDDCDKGSNVDIRRACYEGANTFLTFCFGRTIAPAGPAVPRIRPGNGNNNTMNAGQGYSYSVTITNNFNPNDVVVFVRNEGKMTEVKSFVLPGNDNNVDIFFPDANLDLSKSNSIGVVTAIRQNGLVVSAVASVVEVLHGLDIDNNGQVDKFDYVEACNRYASGEMSFEVFTDYCSDYFSSH